METSKTELPKALGTRSQDNHKLKTGIQAIDHSNYFAGQSKPLVKPGRNLSTHAKTQKFTPAAVEINMGNVSKPSYAAGSPISAPSQSQKKPLSQQSESKILTPQRKSFLETNTAAMSAAVDQSDIPAYYFDTAEDGFKALENFSDMASFHYRCIKENAYEPDSPEYKMHARLAQDYAYRYQAALSSLKRLLNEQERQRELYLAHAAHLQWENDQAIWNTGGENLNDVQARIEANNAEIAESLGKAAEAEGYAYTAILLQDDFAQYAKAATPQKEHRSLYKDYENAYLNDPNGSVFYDDGYYEAIDEAKQAFFHVDQDYLYDFINNIGDGREWIQEVGQFLASNNLSTDEDENGEYSVYTKYAYMTESEIGTYNYLYAQKGADAANEYLRYIDGTLLYRAAKENLEGMSGLEKGLYWIPAGWNQFTEGIDQLLGGDTSVNLMQATSGVLSEELHRENQWLGLLYDLGTTASSQAPSLLATFATHGLLSGVSWAGTAANGLGAAINGLSATGNAYGWAIREGYDEDQAKIYGLFVGISEAGLETILNGAGKALGIGTETVLDMYGAKIAAIDNALLRAAADLGGKLAIKSSSEGLEEFLQELMEPALATLILGEEYDANFGDAAYAFLLSAAFAGVTSLGSYRGGRAKIIDAALAEVDSYLSPDGMDYFDRCYTTRDIMARYERLSQDLDIDVPEVERQRSIRQGVIEGMTAGITAKENANAVSAAVETAVKDYEAIRRRLLHENSEISTNYDVQTEAGYGTIQAAEIKQFIATARETFQKLRSLTEPTKRELADIGKKLLELGILPGQRFLDAMEVDEPSARGAQVLAYLAKEDHPEVQRLMSALMDAELEEVTAPSPGTNQSKWVPVNITQEELDTSLAHIQEFVDGQVPFETVEADYATVYTNIVQSNKIWSWDCDILGGANLKRKQRRRIKQHAVDLGLIPDIKVSKRPDSKHGFADFEAAGVVEITLELPENMWRLPDRVQFQWLNDQIGGEKEGRTWHHTEIPGKMQLIPTGIHNITTHNGGRSPGMWAYIGKKGGPEK